MDDEGTLFVLRRSQLYAEDRCIYTKAIILDENTLLTGVLKSTPRKLFVPDIEEYVKLVGAQGEEFRHSNPNWRAHYSSTVIVPILAPSINNYVLNSAFSGSVIGFLCIDCKSTKAFTKLNKSIILDIMDSFSDALYMLLSQYMHYACKYNVICGNAEEVTSN